MQERRCFNTAVFCAVMTDGKIAEERGVLALESAEKLTIWRASD